MNNTATQDAPLSDQTVGLPANDEVLPAETNSNETSSPESDFGNGATQLNMRFLAFDGLCIPKLGVMVQWDGGEYMARTDANGCLPAVEAPPGAELKIAVQRFNGSYKEIGSCTMPATDGDLTLVSPKLVFETRTEAHEGASGFAEKSIPRPESGDLGDLSPAFANEAMLGEAPVSSEPQPRQTAPSIAKKSPAAPESGQAISESNGTVSATPSPKSKPVQRKPATDSKLAAATPPQHISGKAESKPMLKKGRDENGNPLAVITQKSIDWWNSWRLPTFNLWGGSGTEGTGKGGSVPTTPVRVSAEMGSKVDALLEFAKAQTLYKYDGEGTAAIVASMVNGTFKHTKPENGKEPEKETSKSKGQCYKYVKVALTRAKIIEGVLAAEFTKDISVQECASKAGQALLAKGFVDVTSQVPDLRWAAPGDIIVYEWTQEAWEDRKKKYKNINLPNYGHIDIRSYTNYISDFIPVTGHPGWKSFNVSGIYRKEYDPEPVWRIKAFLRCLRERECTAEHDDAKRYQLLNSPLPGSSYRTFTDLSTHPWSPFNGTPQFDNRLSAAGAYQIQHDTWHDRFEKGAIKCEQGVKCFDRAMQDRVAVAIMETIPPRNTGENSALSDIRRGEIASAMTKLRGTWTCLPGAKEDRSFTQADFMKMYQRFYEEAKKGIS